MSDFNPGEGWVQAAAESRGVEEGNDVLIRVNNGLRTYWVREEPVPPLPTEPYTVIRVSHRSLNFDGMTCILHPVGMAGSTRWRDIGGVADRDLSSITGFEVLAEPRFVLDAAAENYATELGNRVRRETAKAVLDRVRKRVLGQTSWSRTGMDEVATEFGVES